MDDLLNHMNKVPVKLVWAFVGAFGGVARYFTDVMRGERSFSYLFVTMKVVSSLFFGYMGGESAHVLGHPDLAYMSAGLIGYLGSEGFDFIVTLFKKKVGVK